MAGLIPWRKRRKESEGNGGELSPIRDFPSLMRRMQSDFDELVDRFARYWPVSLKEFEKKWRWGLEVDDQEDAVVVRAEAPGFEASDFDVRVEDDRLVLRASKKVEKKDEKGKVHEYREQECYESVTLPAGIDKNKVEAKYHNGMLTVTMPKTTEGKGKRITVKSD